METDVAVGVVHAAVLESYRQRRTSASNAGIWRSRAPIVVLEDAVRAGLTKTDCAAYVACMQLVQEQLMSHGPPHQ